MTPAYHPVAIHWHRETSVIKNMAVKNYIQSVIWDNNFQDYGKLHVKEVYYY